MTKHDTPAAFLVTLTDGSTWQLPKPTYTTIAEFYEGGFVAEVPGKKQGESVVVISWTPSAIVSAIASLIRQVARRRMKDGDATAQPYRFLADADVGDLLDPDQADAYLHIVRSLFEAGYEGEAPAPAA
jgi:hypothetical protein